MDFQNITKEERNKFVSATYEWISTEQNPNFIFLSSFCKLLYIFMVKFYSLTL